MGCSCVSALGCVCNVLADGRSRVVALMAVDTCMLIHSDGRFVREKAPGLDCVFVMLTQEGYAKDKGACWCFNGAREGRQL